jgi:hypothetical protein
MGKGGGLMPSGPSRIAEVVVAFLVPPACREEVLGDLYERFKSPLQYAGDASATVPLVILSRMRRTADPQILLIQAFALYASFLSAAWVDGGVILHEQRGLLRLAVPAALVLLGLILDDTYASPGRRSPLKLAQGPLIGLGIALASQGILWISHPDLALSRLVVFYGCAMSLLLSSAVRMFFPPITEQLLGANAPALWLKQEAGSGGGSQRIIPVLKGISAVAILAVIGTWIADRAAPPKAGIIMLLVVLVLAYQISKRG